MLTLTLIALVLAIPLSSGKISATLYTRIVAIALTFAALLSHHCYPAMISGSLGFTTLDNGIGIYSGLIHTTTVTQMITTFMQFAGAVILLSWSKNILTDLNYGALMQANKGNVKNTNLSYSNNSGISITETTLWPTISEYPIMILFTTIGATFLLASADLVSIYLSIELQSFGLYILAALYRNSESATSAGLKYFLLGALSSALILLGSALVYGFTGLTNLDSIYELISVPCTAQGQSYSGAIILGVVLISTGLLFKVASAPFHYWAPDVYDGTPTIVTTWLTVMPKISLLVFILELFISLNGAILITEINTFTFREYFSPFSLVSITTISTGLVLICAFLSLVIGTVVGLGQYRIKRLLAYSTISHVGFILLSLGIENSSHSTEESGIFLFYLVQYTLTNINAFFVLLAFGYGLANITQSSSSADIGFTSELQGQFRSNPILGLSFGICLFSMAGVPPLVGFFAKYTVLYSAINNGYTWLAIVAILASVVSAVYYLNIIRTIHFDSLSEPTGLPPILGSEGKKVKSFSSLPHFVAQDKVAESINNIPLYFNFAEKTLSSTITSVHSYVIAALTLFILFFAAAPTLILNSTSIMALSLTGQG